jgi:CubicO group peptidase (beta-lactamase class C family)
VTLASHPGVSAVGLLSAWIESQMAYSGLPGLSIGVVHDQERVWAAGLGARRRTASAATPSAFVFELADDGRVTRLTVGDNFLTPVASW